MQIINYGRKISALVLQTCRLGSTEDLNGWMKFGLSKIDLKEKSL
jgi:Tfp pilus assembly protein PilP